jgi:hypothetical protein
MSNTTSWILGVVSAIVAATLPVVFLDFSISSGIAGAVGGVVAATGVAVLNYRKQRRAAP